MKRRIAFRPSALGQLEDRIALSHAGVAEIAPHAQAVSASFRGRVRTDTPSDAGSQQTATLTGMAQIRKFGVLRISGTLGSNGALPPPFSNTSGSLTLTSGSRRAPGTAVLEVTGPAANLAPRTRSAINLTFSVSSATGIFSQYVGAEGTGVLTLQTRPRRGTTLSLGNFTLSASITSV